MCSILLLNTQQEANVVIHAVSSQVADLYGDIATVRKTEAEHRKVFPPKRPVAPDTRKRAAETTPQPSKHKPYERSPSAGAYANGGYGYQGYQAPHQAYQAPAAAAAPAPYYPPVSAV